LLLNTYISTEHGSAGWDKTEGESEIQEAIFLKSVTTATVTKGPLRAEEGYVQNVLLYSTVSRINLSNSSGTKKKSVCCTVWIVQNKYKGTVYRFSLCKVPANCMCTCHEFNLNLSQFFPIQGKCIYVCPEFIKFNLPPYLLCPWNMYFFVSRI
jgi:hypothetical protein